MDDLTQKGIDALKAGDRDLARSFLKAAVKQTPDSERAWSWLYNASNTDPERKYCLEQISRINPDNQKAKDMLAALSAPVELVASAPVTEAQVPPVSSEPPTKKCPYCAETVQADATVCKHCGKNIATVMVIGGYLSSIGAGLTAIGTLILSMLCLWIIFSVLFSK